MSWVEEAYQEAVAEREAWKRADRETARRLREELAEEEA